MCVICRHDEMGEKKMWGQCEMIHLFLKLCLPTDFTIKESKRSHLIINPRLKIHKK